MKKLIAFVLGLFVALPSMAANLPNGYTELEYIQSSGTQWIDTGVVANQNTFAEIDYLNYSDGSGEQFLFGAFTIASGWSTDNFGVNLSRTQNQVLFYDNCDGYTGVNRQNSGKIAILSSGLYVYGNKVTPTRGAVPSATEFTTTYPIALFARRTGTNTATNYITAAVKSFKIYENNSLVRNFIPAKDSRGTVGMYDTVSGQFFTNAGTGTFTAGRELSPCRNLLNLSKLRTNIANYTATTTGFTATGNSAYSGYVGLRGALPAGTYVFSYTKSNNTPYIIWGASDLSQVKINGSSRTENNEGVATFFGLGKGTYMSSAASPVLIQSSVPFSIGFALGASEVTISNLMVESGDTATNYVPYSAACHPVSCENMFDVNNVEIQDNTAIGSDGTLATNSAVNTCVTYIPVQPNTTYTISGNALSSQVSGSSGTAYFRLAQYNSSKQFISRSDGVEGTSYTFTTGANTYYIRFHYANADADLRTYQLTKESCGTCTGNLATYDSATGTVVQNGTPTPTNPIYPIFYTQGKITLRRVGDVADSYDASTGKITRRVGVVTFNGTEDWKYNYVGFWSIPSSEINSSGGKIYCTHFESVDSLPATDSRDDTCWAVEKNISLGLHYGKYGDIDTFKQWLTQQAANGTPVTVWYPLATPTEETVGKTWCETAIKIATTKYNTNAFSGVVTALSNAVDTIKTVVSNTINQATAVANLQSGKQTKPTDTCPAGKTCLLVEDMNGTPHWYEIIERAPGIVPAGSGYTQVEYLQSSGTQYIDTGVTDSVMKWDIVAQRTDESGGQMLLWGYGPSLGLYISNMETGGWNIRISQLDGSKMDKVKLTHDRITGNVVDFYIDDVLKDHVTNCSTASGSAYLFRANNSSNNIWFTGRVYSAQAYKDGSLAVDLVPARRNSDGVLGMYDTVSGNFFTNQGTGKFYAPDQWVPSTYTRLEYIESTGTQWIDTGITASSSKYKVGTRFAAVSGKGAILGNQTGDALLYLNDSGNLVVYSNNAAKQTFSTDSNPHTVVLEYNGTNVTISGDYSYEFETDWNPTQKIDLFANNYNGNPVDKGNVRIYSAKFWNNGTPVRDMVPVRRNSDNELGMYDCVNGVFYDNDGTGKFYAPGESGSRLPSGYTELSYIEKTSSDQYIDTGIKFASEKGKAQVTASFTSASGGMFGAQNGANNTSALLVFNNNAYLGADGIANSNLFTGTMGTATWEANNGNYTIINSAGTTKTGTYTGSIKSTNNWFIGAMKSGSSISGASLGKIASVKLWDNDVLVFDGVPAKNSSDVVGMYDLVSGQFYKDAAGGNFTAGPVAQ